MLEIAFAIVYELAVLIAHQYCIEQFRRQNASVLLNAVSCLWNTKKCANKTIRKKRKTCVNLECFYLDFKRKFAWILLGMNSYLILQCMVVFISIRILLYLRRL